MKLTHREKDICRMVCNGFTAREIANDMCRSTRTIEAYLDNIKLKLKCRNLAQLAAKFTRAEM